MNLILTLLCGFTLGEALDRGNDVVAVICCVLFVALAIIAHGENSEA